MSRKIFQPNLFSRQQRKAHDLHSHNDWLAADEDCAQMKKQDEHDRIADQKAERELATHVKNSAATPTRRMK